ncbi:MAG TPA: hypothetical protein VJO34_11150 [Methylomirabilota bacterium]|nr:hypothetical protein [Methylomirabilota bacterium]
MLDGGENNQAPPASAVGIEALLFSGHTPEKLSYSDDRYASLKQEADQLKVSGKIRVAADQIFGVSREGRFQQLIVIWITADLEVASGGYNLGPRLDHDQIELCL